MNRVSRFSTPSTGAGEVIWRFSHDSLGRVLELDEPTGSPRYFDYDQWGNQVHVYWTNPSTGLVRGVYAEYDGFGRKTRQIQTKFGLPDPNDPQEVELHYDLPSTSVEHLSPTNLMGRLSYVVDPTDGLKYLDDARYIDDARYVGDVAQETRLATPTRPAGADANAAGGGGGAAARAEATAAEVVGRRGAPIEIQAGRNAPASIGGRDFTGHALDRMQGRGLTPSVTAQPQLSTRRQAA